MTHLGARRLRLVNPTTSFNIVTTSPGARAGQAGDVSFLGFTHICATGAAGTVLGST
jgi:hypothetical protein